MHFVLAGLVASILLVGCSSSPIEREPTVLAPLDSVYSLNKNWQVETEMMPNRDSEGLFFAEDDSFLYTATATGVLVALKKEETSRWKDQVAWQVKFASEVVSGPAKYGNQLVLGTA
ncbi:MAG TPA: outer membrane protein assembly factor BamB, partial [Thiomicrorhabdus sp.]|nr:outer membrane protein assembly factor BamB [Thiomicrorhabdus sp.]